MKVLYPTAALLCLVFLSPSHGLSENLPLRELRVTVAATKSFQALPDWKSNFERRVAYATRIFESEFKIKIKIRNYVGWEPSSETAAIENLLEELRGAVPSEGSDLVIGLAHFSEIPRDANMRDLHNLGQARPFTGHLVIRYPANKLYRVQEDTVLVHELGHVFGAIHTGDRNSIMAPVVERQIPSQFDAVNREIIKLTRGIDFQRGIESLSRPQLEALLQSYVKMAKRNDSEDFFFSLGIFYLQLGQSENALKSWRKALSLNPESTELRYHLGALYFKLNRYKEALAPLSRGVSGLNHPAQKMMLLDGLKMLGTSYYETGNIFAAQNAWVRAAAIQPQDHEIRTGLARIKLKQGQVEDAVTMLESVVAENSRSITALSSLGSALNQLGRREEALRYFEMTLSELNRLPRGSDQIRALSHTYMEVGSIYHGMGNQQQAFAAFRAACDIEPSSECHQRLGMTFFREQQWRDAARELTAAIQYDTKNADLYGYLGTALTQTNDLRAAVTVFRQGLELTQQPVLKAQFYRNIGNLFLSTQSYALAEPEFRAALAKNWNDAESHLGLALTQIGLKQTRAATDSLKNVLRIEPQHARAGSILAALEAGGDVYA